MAGQNGYITSAFDDTIPTEFGEAVGEGDLVGFKADGDTRRVMFKALAAAGGTQLAAIGVSPRDGVAGGQESVFRRGKRIALPFPLPAALTSVKPGAPLYVSPTVAGGITKTKPTTTGQLVQVVGYTYYDGGDMRRGQPSDADANGWYVEVQPGTLVP